MHIHPSQTEATTPTKVCVSWGQEEGGVPKIPTDRLLQCVWGKMQVFVRLDFSTEPKS